MFKKLTGSLFQLCLVFLVIMVVSTPALAKDEWLQFSAKEAKTSPLGVEKLKPEIKFYMKGESHPKVLKQMGEFKSNKRSNAFGKSGQTACDTAFISALKAFQDRAEKEGGNAVIDIYTITKNQKFESAEQYNCLKGGFSANVALMGTVVKIAE